MVGKALKWLLLGDDTSFDNPQYEIQNILNDRLYPNVKPQNTSYPCVVYTIEKTSPDKIKELRSPNNIVSIDLDILSKTYSDISSLSTLISNQLHRYKNSYNSATSVSVGFGFPISSIPYNFGDFPPPSTGDVQYVGGLQIQFIELISITESYDEKLEIYRSTLNFDLVYVDDLSIWGADVNLKFTDFNLMAYNPIATANPRYRQPIQINEQVNYLFSPSVLQSDNPNIINSTLDGVYENFNRTMANNSSRPTLKKDISNPPKYNSNFYLEFDTSNYLKSQHGPNRVARKYKELTFFTVLRIPQSYDFGKCANVLFKENANTNSIASVFLYTEVQAGGTAMQLTKFNGGGMALENNAGADNHRGFNFFSGIVSWPLFGMFTDLSFEDPFFFAVSFKLREGDNTVIEGQYELITSSDFTAYGDENEYSSWSDNATTYFKEGFFNFETIHTDIGSYDTLGAGTFNMNDPFNLYDFVMWPEALTFGSSKYLQIKRQIIEKHNMLNRITN
tara:strand:+ start:9556 stop:11073 length:1518 start_codon:yes stop_codon:yes gene_type:complete